jgi:glucosamine-6-phosphate deaminase
VPVRHWFCAYIFTYAAYFYTFPTPYTSVLYLNFYRKIMASKIKLRVVEDGSVVASEAAILLADEVRRRPDAVLGLATGSTPEATYAELVRLHREEGLSFARVRSVNLDEYAGLDGEHEQSYRQYMQRHLFNHIDIRLWNALVPDGVAADAEAECRAYEQRIQGLGGVDMWLTGIGTNGHVAFNEPGSAADSRTRLVDLTTATIESNSPLFAHADEVPRRAFTVGIETLMASRRLLLLATGESKAAAIAAAIEGEVSSACPASFLQEHADCTFLLDRAAATHLSR